MSKLEISRAERLDQYVVRQFLTFPELSRASAAKLIEQGKVLINDAPVTKPGYKIRAHDQIVINYSPDEDAIIPEIELPILYEDDDCVVISKPLGLLTHSKGTFNPEATVATWLRGRIAQDITPDDEIDKVNQRAGIVHRLDRATSGVMICAKNKASLAWLQKQFAQRRTKKTYVAIVSGHLTNDQAIIDMPIERNPKKPQTFRVGVNGKSATTAYTVLETTDHYSLLELKPTTGRTHQLRVHMANLGHPIVGDTLYDGHKADRLFLHAQNLEITLPNRERQVFTVPAPDSFQEFLKRDA